MRINCDKETMMIVWWRCCMIWYDMIWYTLWCDVMWFDMIWYGVYTSYIIHHIIYHISYHVTSHHITSHHITIFDEISPMQRIIYLSTLSCVGNIKVLHTWWHSISYLPLNTLRPRQSGRHFPDDIFKSIFLNENVCISIKMFPEVWS